MFVSRLRPLCRLVAATAVAFGMHSTAAVAQSVDDFPERPLTYVVTVPPGGAADLVGRAFAQGIAEKLGQPVVVENKAGASGTVATSFVARSKPDGYTLLNGAISTHGIGPHFFESLPLPYDAMKDFQTLGVIAEFPLILAVRTDLPVKNVNDLIELAKKEPGKIKFASAGVGSAPHLTAELLMKEAGIEMLHVPYKGSAPAVREVMSGEVDLMFDGLPSLSTGLKSGHLRPIAAVSTKRNSAYPGVPTFTEAGFPNMVASLWYIPMVPAATPAPIVDKLNKALVSSMQGSKAEKALQDSGAVTVYTTPDKTQEFIKKEYAKWGKVIKDAGVTTTKQ